MRLINPCIPSFLANNADADERTLPARPSNICQVCWERPFAAHLGLQLSKQLQPRARLSFSTPHQTRGYSYSTTWADLESRAAQGCLWCKTLAGLRAEGRFNYGKSKKLKITVGESTSYLKRKSFPITPSGTQTLEVFINGDAHFAGYIYTDADDPLAACIVARSRILDVGSPRALALAKECITECVRGHPRCIALAGTLPRSLPTRVVDCSNPENPRLYETDSQDGAYVALSYVWGPPEIQKHKTTKSNLSRYLARGLDLSNLPNTIRDAIHVTHALGLHFLWVDSLCIVQDDDEDKRRELQQMHHIYGSAHLTIIAASAENAGEGFLQSRPAGTYTGGDAFPDDITLPFPLPQHCTPEPAGSTLAAGRAATVVTPQVGRLHIHPRMAFPEYEFWPYHCYGDERISRRGWCIQEAMMARRALLFTSKTLHFRCHTHTQNIGNSIDLSDKTPPLPLALFLRNPAAVVEQESRAWLEMYAAWQRFARHYSRSNVTFPSDKLVACSAIATEFKRVLRSDYLAGLWRARLLNDLLWETSDSRAGSRPAPYRAPSWSWASVDGGVEMGGGSGRSDIAVTTAVAEVIQCEVVLQDPTLPCGQVTGGSITLRAALIRCILRPVDDVPGLHNILLQSAQQARRWGARGMDNSEHDFGVEMETKRVGQGTIDDLADSGIQTLWAVPLLRDNSRRETEGLIVARVVSGSDMDGKFVCRRVGSFYVEHLGVFKFRVPVINVDREIEGRPLVEIELV